MILKAESDMRLYLFAVSNSYDKGENNSRNRR